MYSSLAEKLESLAASLELGKDTCKCLSQLRLTENALGVSLTLSAKLDSVGFRAQGLVSSLG